MYSWHVMRIDLDPMFWDEALLPWQGNIEVFVENLPEDLPRQGLLLNVGIVGDDACSIYLVRKEENHYANWYRGALDV